MAKNFQLSEIYQKSWKNEELRYIINISKYIVINNYFNKYKQINQHKINLIKVIKNKQPKK